MDRREYFSDLWSSDDPRQLPYLTPEQCQLLLIPVIGLVALLCLTFYSFERLEPETGRPQPQVEPRARNQERAGFLSPVTLKQEVNHEMGRA